MTEFCEFGSFGNYFVKCGLFRNFVRFVFVLKFCLFRFRFGGFVQLREALRFLMVGFWMVKVFGLYKPGFPWVWVFGFSCIVWFSSLLVLIVCFCSLIASMGKLVIW